MDTYLDDNKYFDDDTEFDQEDVKGSHTTFIVDTADTSGHFASSVSGTKIVAGCVVTADAVELNISEITGDGTGADSVTFDDTISTGTKTVSKIS